MVEAVCGGGGLVCEWSFGWLAVAVHTGLLAGFEKENSFFEKKKILFLRILFLRSVERLKSGISGELC